MIGVIGSGTWATAIVKILLEQEDRTVNWWVRSDEVREGLEREGRNPKYLPTVQLDHSRLNISGELAKVVAESDYLFLVTPSAYIANGETMTLENLLYCAMIASANDACNVIAEYVGGTISGFVDMMNTRAAELGCTETHFTNTHGLPDDAFDGLDEDKLKTLDTLLAQIQAIH